MLNRTKHRDLQLYLKNKHIPRKNRSDLCLLEAGMRKLDEGSQKVQAFSYKSTRDLMNNMINTINTTVCCM